MANTFSQIYIQTIFAVSGRLSLVRADFKKDLYKYITGIVKNKGQKLVSINGMEDHLHILIGLKPAMALADLVRDIKALIRRNGLIERNSLEESLGGKKGMEHSRTDIRN